MIVSIPDLLNLKIYFLSQSSQRPQREVNKFLRGEFINNVHPPGKEFQSI
jgi:hypothetical protein